MCNKIFCWSQYNSLLCTVIFFHCGSTVRYISFCTVESISMCNSCWICFTVHYNCKLQQCMLTKSIFVPGYTFDWRLWHCCELGTRLSAEAKNPVECERGAGEMQGIVQTYCIHSFVLFGFFQFLGPFSIFEATGDPQIDWKTLAL